MEMVQRWFTATRADHRTIKPAKYRDHKNAFVLTREASDTELLKGTTKPLSHWAAMQEIGHRGNSGKQPQAKGRVERNHGVDHDRLVKDLRLECISTLAEANRLESHCQQIKKTACPLLPNSALNHG
jgi:hypothetical protein